MMATVQFFEKPGCIINSKQKALLIQAGHELVVHDLLKYPWAEQPAYLRSFFGSMPVADWFNRAAPDIKNGVVVPEMFDEQQALALMLNNPLLIRRPLLEIAGKRWAGFNHETLTPWLETTAITANLEQCPQTAKSTSCRP